MLDKKLYDPGIERGAGHLLQQRQRVFSLHAFAIRTIAARCVIEIDDRYDPCHQRNLFRTQTLRITTAIPLFVVKANDVLDRIWKVHALKDVASHGGMNLHLREFGFSKFARLVQNIFRDS